jgi:hypothetical protein
MIIVMLCSDALQPLSAVMMVQFVLLIDVILKPAVLTTKFAVMMMINVLLIIATLSKAVNTLLLPATVVLHA